MGLLIAFLARDINLERSYRFHFAVKILAAFFQLAVFFFISRFIQAPAYFPFVFIGLVFSRFFQFWLNVFSENIRQEQYWGTAEPLFLSPAPPLSVVVASSAGKFLLLLVELAVYGLFGAVVFNVAFNARLLLLLPFVITGALAFGGLGLLAGGFILYFKRGDPVTWLLAASFDLLSGVYFPVAVLPQGLQGVSSFLPTTSALALWRTVLLSGAAPTMIDIALQVFWALLLMGAGVIGFTKAFGKIRAKGDLGSY